MYNYLSINVLQNLLFCITKAAVLHGKSIGFALQKSRFRNVKSKLSFFLRIIFTKQSLCFCGIEDAFSNCLNREEEKQILIV
ncbi:hypothetical protein CTM53_07390 [Prevotella intermedia]|uniref:Uncharacterized protein n=1 Tax=Prevotella intermedia TaxID=28131 RepID=A0AAJ3VFE7_PREIN|nr:hypothetical protein CTM61_02230 [Prevotella intermedia]PJI20653.1 hypothetical protein CTM53_07390 [Prevotella intermedia]